MDVTLIWLFGGLLLLLGFVGCLVPVLPGPLLGYASLWAMWLFGHSPGMEKLAIGGAVVVGVTVVDYLLPTFFARRFKCSKYGAWGCILGTIAGLFFLPWGLVLGPVLGTMGAELLVGKSMGEAVKGGVGAFCGFIACLLLKLVAVGLFAGWFLAEMMR